jgi:hypothetical protein
MHKKRLPRQISACPGRGLSAETTVIRRHNRLHDRAGFKMAVPEDTGWEACSRHPRYAAGRVASTPMLRSARLDLSPVGKKTDVAKSDRMWCAWRRSPIGWKYCTTDAE